MITTEASPPPGLSFLHMLAGLLGMAAAALLLALHPEALASRWQPTALAAVHLFALAGLMPVMLGALYQFVPVACGLRLPRWGVADFLGLLALVAGALALADGFLTGARAGFMLAACLLPASLTLALARLAWALWHQPVAGELVAAMRRSAFALGATLLLACLLLGVLLAGWRLPLVALANWHAQWGLAGWVGGLILAVAGVVVPMFHVAAPYPAWWSRATRVLPWALLLGGATLMPRAVPLSSLAALILAGLALAFGGLTLQRVHAAKRGERDAFHFGWLGVGAIAMALACLGLPAQFSADPRWAAAFGVLALAGLGGGTVSVMLYRIVPFLIWLHAQRANAARVRLPLLHQIVPERWARVQLGVDAIGIVLLCVGAFVPALVQVGALALAASKLGQGVLLARAMRDFRRRLAVLRSLPPRVRTEEQ